MKRRRLLAAAAGLGLACGLPPPAGAPPTSPPPSGGTLRVALAEPPVGLDPSRAVDAGSLLVTRQVFETLVDYEPASMRLVPQLARSWDVSADGLVWTMVLRDDVRFSDGTPLDADAVVRSFARGRAADAAAIIRAVEARSSSRVAITTGAPYGPLLSLLALPSFAIQSGGGTGTGPFRATSVDGLVLERNPLYRGAPASIDRVAFRVLREASARVAELRSGAVDLLTDVAPAEGAVLKGDPNLVVLARPALDVGYLGFDAASRPFDDRALRRAVGSAVNRSLLATAVVGDARVVAQLVPAGLLGFDETVTEFIRYDDAFARRALADAGLAGGLQTELWYPPAGRPWAPDPRRLAAAIAADLARVGVNATLRTEDDAGYDRDAVAGRFPLWLGGSGGRPLEPADPDLYFAGLARVGPLAELLRAAHTQVDGSRRAELYKQASRLVQQDVLRLPLLQVSALAATSRKVSGYAPHPAGIDSFASLRLSR